MHSQSTLRLPGRGWAIVLVVALLALGFSSSTGQAAAATPPRDGLVCTTNPSATFTLTTKDGDIELSDGNTVYMWGYAPGDGEFQHPGPVLCVTQGQTVTIVLRNDLPVDVSMTFPGQTEVLADGAPSQPVFDGSGTLTSLTKAAAMTQIQMGLFGALIVRPTMGPDYAYNYADTRFNPDAEFLVLLSEIDPLMHAAIQRGEAFDVTQYHPRYWLVNGRISMDTIAPNFVTWLPHQPYGALQRIHPYDPVNNPFPALVRYVGVGAEDYPFHPHGNFSRVIARDGKALKGPAGEDMTYNKFTIEAGPGQTTDILYTWEDANHWDPVTNPIPVPIPQVQDQTRGQLYSGSPYLGDVSAPTPGEMTFNQCGEYYIISHNHALHQITAWGGLTMSGQATFIRVDPPLPNNCP
jgi:FtsP/CotA-like multicopper oxidase with cupredoxin domain